VKEILLKQKEKAVSFWNRLSSLQKVLFVGGTLLIISLAVILIISMSKPNYAPLYTDLDTQDAADITAYLKEQKVLYKLEGGGSTILVPESQKYDLRLALADEGIPKGGSVGFESLNETRFGETESERQVRYTVALQGELERTIRQLEAVDDARVHIVKPESSLFVEEEKEATAAVLVKLKPGTRLNADQVNGMVNLVVGGVEGLKPNNVTVVDTQGNILSAGLAGGTENENISQLTARQQEIEREYENKIEKSIKEMLDQVIGQGKSVVRASATLDFDQVEINRETYGDKSIRSQEVEDEHTTDNGTSVGGGAGTPSNIPQYEEEEENSAGGSSDSTRKTTNYEVDLEKEHRIAAPGEVKQLSLSVVLDAEQGTVQEDEIADMVTAAAGLNTERGDQLTVSCMPFDRSWAEQMGNEMASEKNRQKILYYGLAAAAILVLLIIGALIIYRRKREAEKVIEYSEGARPTVDDFLEAEEGGAPINEEEREKERIVEQIKAQIKQQPEKAAELLKTWLGEDQR